MVFKGLSASHNRTWAHRLCTKAIQIMQRTELACIRSMLMIEVSFKTNIPAGLSASKRRFLQLGVRSCCLFDVRNDSGAGGLGCGDEQEREGQGGVSSGLHWTMTDAPVISSVRPRSAITRMISFIIIKSLQLDPDGTHSFLSYSSYSAAQRDSSE